MPLRRWDRASGWIRLCNPYYIYSSSSSFSFCERVYVVHPKTSTLRSHAGMAGRILFRFSPEESTCYSLLFGSDTLHSKYRSGQRRPIFGTSFSEKVEYLLISTNEVNGDNKHCRRGRQQHESRRLRPLQEIMSTNATTDTTNTTANKHHDGVAEDNAVAVAATVADSGEWCYPLFQQASPSVPPPAAPPANHHRTSYQHNNIDNIDNDNNEEVFAMMTALTGTAAAPVVDPVIAANTEWSTSVVHQTNATTTRTTRTTAPWLSDREAATVATTICAFDGLHNAQPLLQYPQPPQHLDDDGKVSAAVATTTTTRTTNDGTLQTCSPCFVDAEGSTLAERACPGSTQTIQGMAGGGANDNSRSHIFATLDKKKPPTITTNTKQTWKQHWYKPNNPNKRNRTLC